MRAVSSVSALLFLAGCSSAPGPSAVASSQASLASPPPIEAHEPAPPAEVARRPIAEGALVEGPGSRDPFRAYAPVPGPGPRDTRPRKARRIPIDQLRLVALVTNTPDPRAMLVDLSGKGYIVKVGELVGRPEPSSAAGDDGYRTASYRVDRIRNGDVVLVREDAASPAAAPATRVLSLPRDPPREADD
jgi:type IV pilus assembly protein PilP